MLWSTALGLSTGCPRLKNLRPKATEIQNHRHTDTQTHRHTGSGGAPTGGKKYIGPLQTSCLGKIDTVNVEDPARGGYGCFLYEDRYCKRRGSSPGWVGCFLFSVRYCKHRRSGPGWVRVLSVLKPFCKHRGSGARWVRVRSVFKSDLSCPLRGKLMDIWVPGSHFYFHSRRR